MGERGILVDVARAPSPVTAGTESLTSPGRFYFSLTALALWHLAGVGARPTQMP
jgi:hypothetical protein